MTEAIRGIGVAGAPTELRSQLRFPVVADIDYRVLSGRLVKVGRGQTVNLSSGGVLFHCNESLPVGRRIELWIVWPVHLNGDVALRLCVRGRIARVKDNCVAVEFRHYEFRTRRLEGSMSRSAAGAV